MYNNVGKTRGLKKLKEETDRRAIRIIQMNWWWPPYWDDGVNFKGNHPTFKWRSYKTWKHQRKYQWKINKQLLK